MSCASTAEVPSAPLRNTLPANWPGLSPVSARLPGSQGTLVRQLFPLHVALIGPDRHCPAANRLAHAGFQVAQHDAAASTSLHCSDKSRTNSSRDELYSTICVVCACTGSSSASRKLTAIASPPTDCAPRYSTPGCMIARCAPDWPLSRPLQPIQQSPMAKSIRAAETAINNWYDQTKFAA